MHRVHHSTIDQETNSNFGFNLSLWDRVFQTDRPWPQKGHRAMAIGLDQWSDPKQTQRLKNILTMPFGRGK